MLAFVSDTVRCCPLENNTLNAFRVARRKRRVARVPKVRDDD